MVNVKFTLSENDIERILQSTGDTFQTTDDVRGELESLLSDDPMFDSIQKSFIDGIIGFYQEQHEIREEHEINILDIRDIHWWFERVHSFEKLLEEVFQSKQEREYFKKTEDKLYKHLICRHEELMVENKIDRDKKMDEIENIYEKRIQILKTINNK